MQNTIINNKCSKFHPEPRYSIKIDLDKFNISEAHDRDFKLDIINIFRDLKQDMNEICEKANNRMK